MTDYKHTRNPGIAFNSDWLDSVEMNRSAIERRCSTLTKRRSIKKDWQAAWLLKSLCCMDLTTLSSDDTQERVRRLCAKARQPLRPELIESLGVKALKPRVGAVCVYHDLINRAKKQLNGMLPIAAVSTGFPAGLSSLETKKKEIKNSINEGADEIDIVINRSYVLRKDWKNLYEEVRSYKEIAKTKKLKAILGVGDLETLRNVGKASLVCMMAGADFIKTSTGKEKINANLNNSLVMLRMIREFYSYSGKKIGFKPAGGISSAKGVLEFLILVYEELGEDWINEKLLRIGASSLLIDIERQLYHYALGRYANKEKIAMS